MYKEDWENWVYLCRFMAPIWAGVFFFFGIAAEEVFLVCVAIASLLIYLISFLITKKWEKEGRQRCIEQENISKGIQKIEMVCECGAVYPAGATFCAKCGKQLTKRIVDNYVWKCPVCGKIFGNGEKFCPEHGKELVKSPKE